MIYLRYVWERACLANPTRVVVHAADPPWLERQVVEEMSLLFPDASVIAAADDLSSPDLLVFVLASGAGEAARQLAWVEQHKTMARVALGLYTAEPRNLEIVPVGKIRHWRRIRLLTNFALRWRRRWSRTWSALGTLCGSFS